MVSGEGAGYSVLLLAEDHDDRALRIILARLFGKLVPGVIVDSGLWEGERTTDWKSRARGRRVSLLQRIATTLVTHGGFVFFHYDGDRPYRDRVESENTLKFQSLVRRELRTRAEDRTALDELVKPKESLCFGALHNAELARRAYPLDEVLDARRSLWDVYTSLRACDELIAALKAVLPPWRRTPEV